MNNNKAQGLKEEEKKKIADVLTNRINHLTCPMCSNNNFIITDGYLNPSISTNLDEIVLGGQSIPTIGIICANCGFISQHALGILGLLNKTTDQ